MRKNIVIFDTQNCVGCRTCELVCSYHHIGVFRPSTASIEVIDRLKDLRFTIGFYYSACDGHLACDGCEGLDEPLCIKYCNNYMRDELKEILETTRSMK